MNVTASFVRFGVQGYPELPLPSEACVSLCAGGHRAVHILRMKSHKNNLLALILSFGCEFEVEKSIKNVPTLLLQS